MATIIDALTSALTFISGFTGNYGWAIVVLTIIIRIVIFPLTITQYRAMGKMQELAPETERLQKKYKDNQEKMNQEMMKLWKKHGVNPLAGCLPLLIQIPILYGFFRTIDAYEPLSGASFFWVQSLGAPDPTYIFPVLAGVATFLQTVFITPTTSGGGTGAHMQLMMKYGMPFFIVWISTQFPSGLAVYWVVSALFGAGQGYYIRSDRARREKGESAS